MKLYGVSVSKTVSGGASEVSASSYQALLDAMRDEEEDDGTIGFDTSTNKYYRYYSPSASFPGILVPPRSYERISGYMSSSTGFAYFEKSDGLGDLVARGWEATIGAGASITKTSGSSLTIDTGTGYGISCYMKLDTSWAGHTSTAGTKALYAIKLTGVTSSATYQSSQPHCMIYIRDGAESSHVSVKCGATNKICLTKGNASGHTGTGNTIPQRPAMPRWFFVEVDNTDSDGDGNRTRLTRLIDIDGHHHEENYAYKDSDDLVITSHVYALYATTWVGGQNVVHIEEYHCLAYSS